MLDADPRGQLVAVKLVRRLCPGVQVGTRVPRDPPDMCVVVTRTGGGMANRITDQPMITVQCYGADEFQAECFAGALRHELVAGEWPGTRVGGVMVRGWREAAGPARFPDPHQPRLCRFQFSGQLLVSTLTSTS